MAVIVKIANQRHAAVHGVEALADMRHRRRRRRRVHGNAHQFRTGLGQRPHLHRRAFGVLGIGIGHALHEDRRATANAVRPDRNADAGVAWRLEDTAVHAVPLSLAEHFLLCALQEFDRRGDRLFRALHQIGMADIFVNDEFATWNIVSHPLRAGARGAGFHRR